MRVIGRSPAEALESSSTLAVSTSETCRLENYHDSVLQDAMGEVVAVSVVGRQRPSGDKPKWVMAVQTRSRGVVENRRCRAVRRAGLEDAQELDWRSHPGRDPGGQRPVIHASRRRWRSSNRARGIRAADLRRDGSASLGCSWQPSWIDHRRDKSSCRHRPAACRRRDEDLPPVRGGSQVSSRRVPLLRTPLRVIARLSLISGVVVGRVRP